MTARSRKEEALECHALPAPGKLEVVATKPCVTQRDLSLAYTPGVAEPCLAITENPADVYRYTSKRTYIIPKPFDPRVLIWEAAAVAEAAMRTGVAQKPVDLGAYRVQLEERLGRAREAGNRKSPGEPRPAAPLGAAA